MLVARKYRNAGEMREAAVCYAQILAQDPDHADANRKIAAVLQDSEQPERAFDYWEKALAVEPDNVSARFNYARCLNLLHRNDESMEQYQRAFKIMHRTKIRMPIAKMANVHFLRGFLYRDLIQDAEEEKSFHRAVDMNPEFASAYFELGSVLGRMGRSEESIAANRKALQLEPDMAPAHRALAMAKKHTEVDNDIKAAERLYESRRLTTEYQMDLAFGLGKAYEDLKQYRKAFQYWADGNRMHRQMNPYVLQEEVDERQSLRESFTSAYIKKEGSTKFTEITPVFVVSMPRSGSSLVEQILASYSAVYGGGEMTTVWDILQQAVVNFPGDLPRLKQADWERLGTKYLEAVICPMQSESFITDKLPGNWATVGAIRMMLPGAKIVHCSRDPMDTALSCFKNSYFANAMPYSYDLRDIGGMYKVYEKTLAHWRKILPGWVYDIQYEDLVSDPEPKVRSLLDFLGLPFEENCLSFYATKRSTRTASMLQVREPIYQTSVKKWKNFEQELQPFRKARKGGFFSF